MSETKCGKCEKYWWWEGQNARDQLNAAAPDLYAALEALLADVDEYERVNNLHPNPGKTETWASKVAARAALSRARGETT